jgi:hypothetical protein
VISTIQRVEKTGPPWRILPGFSAFLDACTDSIEEETVKRSLEVGGVLLFALVQSPFLEGKEPGQSPRSKMTVLVCYRTGVEAEIRTQAKAEVTRIFAVARVDLTWVEVHDPAQLCMIRGADTYFTLVVSLQAPKNWSTNFDAMGLAPVRTGLHPRAYVCYELVKAFVGNFTPANQKMELGAIMGHAIAHELGHLVLPDEAHGEGLMRSHWGYVEWENAMKGGLVFVADHERLIHNRLKK